MSGPMSGEKVTTPAVLIGGKEIKAVSFALFGAVLTRRCYSVEGLYERTLHHAPMPQRIRDMAESFIQHRVLAQNVLRLNNPSARSTVLQVSGISIEAIYDRFAVHSLNLPRSVRPQLIEAEIQAELELAIVDPDFLPLYHAAKQLGRRVGVVAESHWSAAQIERILDHAAPDLAFDFIYSANGPAGQAAGGLFRYYLDQEKLRPAQAVHFGVDTDTVAQPTAGIAHHPMPTPHDPWENLHKREEAAARLLAIADRGFRWRLDGGLHRLRVAAVATLGRLAVHHQIGATVMGPVMVGFQRLVEQRVAELRKDGRNVRVLYLARDGYLPMRVWQAAAAGPADYAEINRRIAMIAGSEGDGGLETIQGLITTMAHISANGVRDFFKIKPSKKVLAFFENYEDGLAVGEEFAKAMPKLIGRKVLKALSDNLRRDLMAYLDAKTGNLADCTDLVLVDIGYTGNIQKGLRRAFDVAGLKIRLHGIYLMPHGESFAELPGEDSVCGYFDDTVMTPAVKRAVMRDAPLLEEFCCAPVGSARGYSGAQEIREPEVRQPHEIAFCLEMQDECIRYFDAFRDQCRRHKIDPLADFDTYRAWTAAILARFVMMPTQLECQTFGPLMHDVSLGSRGLIATITTADIRKLMGALPFPTVASIHHPPVWLGGSLAAHVPIAGFAYGLTGFGLPTDDMLKDIEITDGDAVILKDGVPIAVPVARALTPFGDVRLRIPVLKKDGESVIALPLRENLARGIIRSVILQGGPNVADATTNRYGVPLPLDQIQALRVGMDGNFFRAVEADPFLLFTVPALQHAVSVLTVVVTPLPEV